MRAIRRFTIHPVLPEPLEPLRSLMLNLRWSWHAETRELFAAIDPASRELAEQDPVALLAQVPQARLQELAADPEFLQRLSDMTEDLRDYLTGPRWYQASGGAAAGLPAAIAYFSPEYGITAALPQYSGGLGILAGDHLKAASDLGVPLIGVGLLYRHGYFTQSLSADGWQTERYPASDPNGLPLTLLRAADGSAVRVSVGLAGGLRLAAQIWVAEVGRIPLLLLDSYVEENDPGLREVTDRLYGGGTEHRLRQELLLGVGGVHAVRAYCALTGRLEPEVFHTNEGHAGFLGLERIREYVQQGLSFDEALEVCRAGTVFTTHTPVPAGIDRFPLDLVARNVGEGAEAGLPADRILALGAESYPGGDPGVFNMAVMGMRLAQRVNGVSALHGKVSRAMFTGLWPGFDVAEVPITSVTNGVHAPTWVASEVVGLADGQRRGQAADWPLADPSDNPEFWEQVAADPRQLWQVRRMLRIRLIEQARRRLRASWRQRGASDAELIWTDSALDEDVLTIGFARRVPSYKRLTMMMHDPARLTALLLDPERPIQIVVAGKAHPADDGGKQLIQQLVKFADSPQVRHRIVFLPDYDMAMAKMLVQGCDVWLNNPLRPLEACGTSGMKAALNGALNLSVLDGWWDEWYDGRNGWAIPSADGVTDPGRRDELEAAALYDLLGTSVAPLFYQAGPDGLPDRWLEMVSHTLRTLGPKALATRMVRQYVTQLYAPSAQASRVLTGTLSGGEVAVGGSGSPASEAVLAGQPDFARARELAAWKKRVAGAWPGVRVEHVEADDSQLIPGGSLTVRASIALGTLTPDDVTVEVVYGRAGDSDELLDPHCAALQLDGAVTEGVARYAGAAELGQPGPFGYTVRVLPHHSLLGGPAELGLVTVPDAPSGMTNGDLR
ncbi:MAG TPA: alpha-glucan family phosphorylase [Streptosporangiaceae bacterium]|nr:alpha-glucan family phosphorylase [Streptosporangiaceae bacterium]